MTKNEFSVSYTSNYLFSCALNLINISTTTYCKHDELIFTVFYINGKVALFLQCSVNCFLQLIILLFRRIGVFFCILNKMKAAVAVHCNYKILPIICITIFCARTTLAMRGSGFSCIYYTTVWPASMVPGMSRGFQA